MKKIIAAALCIITVATLITVFTACGKNKDNDSSTDVSTETAGGGLNAEVKSDSLDIYKGDTLLQTLTYPDAKNSAFSLDYAKEHVEFIDMNFDGESDVCLAINKNEDEISYYCWLYDASSKKYVYSAELSALKTISVDAEGKQIISLAKDKNSKSYYVCYEWKDGVLTEAKKLSTSDKDKIPTSVDNAIKNNTVGDKVTPETTSRSPSAGTTKKTPGTTKKKTPSTTKKQTTGSVSFATGDIDDGWY